MRAKHGGTAACPLNAGAQLLFLCRMSQQVGLQSANWLYWAGDSNGQVVCIENLSYPPGKGEDFTKRRPDASPVRGRNTE